MTEKSTLEQAFELHQQQKLDEAEDFYKQALMQNPKNSQIYDLLGKLYFQKKDYKSSVEILERGLQIDEKDYELWFDYALSTKNLGECQRAKDAYYKALGLNPKLSDAYFNLAYLHYNDNEPDKAVECYKKYSASSLPFITISSMK